MAKEKEPVNPFYVLLVLTGIAFCITACAFGVMTVRGLRPEIVGEISESSQTMLEWMDKNGFGLMMIELVALGIFTVGAIGLDEIRTKKAEQQNQAD